MSRADDYVDASVSELGAALRAGAVTSLELTEQTLARAAGFEPSLRAFVCIDEPGALRAARNADRELAEGIDKGPMHGISYGLKDIFDAAGLPTSCCSRVQSTDAVEADSHVAARMRAGGAVLIGKLATHEYAVGVPSEDSFYPPPRNPWNLGHITGGSSSGSAAAVGAGLLRVATGSCTGGSIRGPAAWCGAVGLKPTYGRVSRRGVFPLAWTLDHCGPIAKNVEDCAIALQVMAGYDPLDAASANQSVPDYRIGLRDGVAGMRIGVPRGFFEMSAKLSPDTRQGIEKTILQLRERGAVVEDVVLPDFAVFSAVGRLIIASEMYAVHRRLLATRMHDYDDLTITRLTMGLGVSSAEYLAAQRVRSDLISATNAVFARYDTMLTAISLDSAPAATSKLTAKDWPLQMNMFNVTGHPAISVPIGLDHRGLPMAVQLAGRPFEEGQLLRLAQTVEMAAGWAELDSPINASAMSLQSTLERP